MEFLAVWDIRVTIDLFLGGIGIAAFIWSVLASYRNRPNDVLVVRIGGLLAPVAVGLGLLILATKLGRIQNMWAVATGVYTDSMMYIGMFLQGAFMAVAMLYALRLISSTPRFDTSMRIIQGVGVVLAIGVGLYHGLLLTNMERVLWSALVPVLFFVSSMAGGLATILFIETGLPDPDDKFLSARDDRTNILSYLVGFLALQFVILLVWQYQAVRSGLEAQLSYEFFMENFRALWWLTLLLGTLIPTAALAAGLFPQRRFLNKIILAAVSVMVILGGFGLKHLIILGGQIAVSLELLSSF